MGTELRFTSDWTDANTGESEKFNREVDGTGDGLAFAILSRPNVAYATANGADWNGVVTMIWDPNRKLYFCPSFEAIFDRVRETKTDGNAEESNVHEAFEVQFPELTTDVSTDGQCLFATGDRPLGDGGFPKTIECTVNQANLLRGINKGVLNFGVFPFRIATGYDSVIYGKGRAESYFARVRNIEPSKKVEHLKRIVPAAHLIVIPDPNTNMFNHDANDNNAATSRLLELGTVSRYTGEANRPVANMPLLDARNEIAGTSWQGMPSSLDQTNLAFGWTYLPDDTTDNAFATRPCMHIVGLTPAIVALMSVSPPVVAADGWVAPANALPAAMSRRVARRFDTAALQIATRVPGAFDDGDDEKDPFEQFKTYMAAEATAARLTVAFGVYETVVSTVPLAGGNAVEEIVPYQSYEHYTKEQAKLEIEVQRVANLLYQSI